MRRTASSVLRDLEIRVANLEKQASRFVQANMYSDIKNVIKKHLSRGLPLSPSQTQSLIEDVSHHLTYDIYSMSQDSLAPHMGDVAENYFDDFDDRDIFMSKMRAIYTELRIR